MNECKICHQMIGWDRSLCDACDNDLRDAQEEAGDAERVFKERQARAACVE